MIPRACGAKFHVGSLSVLLFLFAMLVPPPVATAQTSPLDVGSVQPSEGRGAVLSGTVYLGKDNQLASQVIVTVRSHRAGIFRSVLTGFDGRFELRGLPPGVYQISAEEPGYESASTTAHVNFIPSNISLYLKSVGSYLPRGTSYSVSLHELEIPMKARDEFERGLERLIKQDPTGSLPHFAKAAAVFPDYYEAYYHLGVAQTRLKQDDPAMRAFQKAIDLSGGHYAPPQFGLGLLWCYHGKPDEGERIVRRGLENDSNDPLGHLILAISLYQQDRLEEAEKSAREALRRRPAYADVYIVLSDIHGKNGDYRAQLQDLDSFLNLAPDAPGIELVRKTREVVKRLVARAAPQN